MMNFSSTSRLSSTSTSTDAFVPKVTASDFQNKDKNPSHYGNIQFFGRGDQLAHFIQIDDDTDVKKFRQFMFDSWKLSPPNVLLSVTGGAQDFKLRPRLEQVFSRGLVRAAQNTSAWIVTAGLDTGVMQYVGRAVRVQEAKVPTIAIAPYQMVTHKEVLEVHDKVVTYKKLVPNTAKSAALDPNHTHFILVDNGISDPFKGGWGSEITFRSNLEHDLTKEKNIPLVLVVVEGGPGTFKTVREGVEKGFPVVVVEGSGRAADAIACAWRKANGEKVDTDILTKFSSPHLDVIIQKGKELNNITLFDLKDDNTQDMDVFILRAILNDTQRDRSLEKKLLLGVEWNRKDILQNIFESAELSNTMDANVSADILPALDSAFQTALELDRHNMIDLLLKSGARRENTNIKKLYSLPKSNYALKQLVGNHQNQKTDEYEEWPEPTAEGEEEKLKDSLLKRMSGLRLTGNFASKSVYSHSQMFEDKFTPLARQLFAQWLPQVYLDNDDMRVSFTDLLIWAVLVNRKEMAYTLWKRTSLPMHSALLCSYLYRKMASTGIDNKTFEENADFFEELAIGVMDEFQEYQQAKEAIELPWGKIGRNAIKLAALGESKNFIAHPFCQRLLDEEWCSTSYGKIKPRLGNFRVISMILFPFLIQKDYKRSRDLPKASLYHFYELPVVKLWTNTLFYLAFLLLISIVAVEPRDFDFSVYEVLLFIWLLGLVVDEVMQYLQDREGHFEGFWNKVDFTMYSLLVTFFILRFCAVLLENEFFREKANDVLVVDLLICYIRLMNVFSVNYHLGPLLVMIGKMVTDIAVFFLIFALFIVSFSLAFISLTREAIAHPELFKEDEQPSGTEWFLPYPEGTLGLPFWGFLGEFGETLVILNKTDLGPGILGVYLVLANILLVNLMIAMMNDTYSNIRDNSDRQWKFSRYFLVKEYRKSNLFPPPLNLILLGISFFQYCVSMKRAINQADVFDDDEGTETIVRKRGKDKEIVVKRVQSHRETFLEARQEKEDRSTEKQIDALKERIEAVVTSRAEDREFMETQFKHLESTINSLIANLKINQPTA